MIHLLSLRSLALGLALASTLTAQTTTGTEKGKRRLGDDVKVNYLDGRGLRLTTDNFRLRLSNHVGFAFGVADSPTNKNEAGFDLEYADTVLKAKIGEKLGVRVALGWDRSDSLYGATLTYTPCEDLNIRAEAGLINPRFGDESTISEYDKFGSSRSLAYRAFSGDDSVLGWGLRGRQGFVDWTATVANSDIAGSSTANETRGRNGRNTDNELDFYVGARVNLCGGPLHEGGDDSRGCWGSRPEVILKAEPSWRAYVGANLQVGNHISSLNRDVETITSNAYAAARWGQWQVRGEYFRRSDDDKVGNTTSDHDGHTLKLNWNYKKPDAKREGVSIGGSYSEVRNRDMNSVLLNLDLWDLQGQAPVAGLGTNEGAVTEWKIGAQIYTQSCFTHYVEFAYQDIDRKQAADSDATVFYLGTRVNF